MRFGSVCSGIEAASVAFGPLGWKAAWFAEVEPFPSAVLAHHYPETPNLGDMTTISRRVLTGEVEAPDVLCGGTPCQAFSVAGLRESLADERGNLTLKFVELADAIDHVRVTRGDEPAIVFWENVPGVLSTKDNAFGCFLAGLAGESFPLEPAGGRWTDAGCVFGPKRAIAWRVLDAQHFKLAQRRRRVFVVASARDGFDPATVLFEWDGVRRDSPPRREAGESLAPCVTAGAANGGAAHGARSGSAKDNLIVPVAFGGNNQSSQIDVATACNACASASGRMDFETETFLVQPTHTLRGEGFDAGEDGTGRGTPLVPHVVGALACNTGPNGHDAGNFACNQAVDAGHVLPVAFAENSRHELRLEGGDGQRTGALSTGGGKPGQGVPMIAFPANLSGTQHAAAVRRLMPVECERLMGFPDDYTNIPWTEYRRLQRRAAKAGASYEVELRKRGKELRGKFFPGGCPDGPRYKAIGNSWAVTVVSWIGRRIQEAINGNS